MRFKCVVLFISLFLFTFIHQAFAHQGDKDENGCHYVKKTGEYHCHGKKNKEQEQSPTQRSSTLEPSTTQPTKSKINSSNNGLYNRETGKSIKGKTVEEHFDNTAKINEYFRHANENVGAFDCNIRVNQRNIDESTKRAVKRINGNQCVICGSTYKLEVDHMRALQNGGTNDMSNLATLCDDCHLIKTKYDNSLRRKRNNVCRKK